MGTQRYPEFRDGAELTTRFTGTLTERHGDTVERIGDPTRFVQWLHLNGLVVRTCSHAELERAYQLREAIHRLLNAQADGVALPAADRDLVNAVCQHGRAVPQIDAGGQRTWLLGPTHQVADALAVIAADAIDILCGHRPGRLARCASPTCREAFLDTSQSHSRRWCDMNSCGNRQKKARLKANRAPSREA